MIKFAVYGLSGCGKSTVGRMISEYYSSRNKKTEFIKLAYPLYQIQHIFYETAGKTIGFYEQDQVLLESIAGNLRKISNMALADNFLRRLKQSDGDVVINDDVRDYQFDYPALKKEGFLFIKVFCDEELRIRRLKERNDISVTLVSKTTRDIDKFSSDLAIDTNSSDLDKARTQLHRFLDQMGEVKRFGENDINR